MPNSSELGMMSPELSLSTMRYLSGGRDVEMGTQLVIDSSCVPVSALAASPFLLGTFVVRFVFLFGCGYAALDAHYQTISQVWDLKLLRHRTTLLVNCNIAR